MTDVVTLMKRNVTRPTLSICVQNALIMWAANVSMALVQ